MLALVNTPGLARLDARYDDQATGWSSALMVRAWSRRRSTPAGREQIAAELASFVLGLEVNPLTAMRTAAAARDWRWRYAALPRQRSWPGHASWT